MELVCHMPTFVYASDLTESIRKASVSEMLASLETAAEIEAVKVVLHPGSLSGMGLFAPDLARVYAFENLEIFLERAKALGLRLCVENMPPKNGVFCEMAELGPVFQSHSWIQMTFDTGHAHIEDKNGNRVSEILDTLGPRIGHLHVSDNKGKRDDHLPVGSGTVPFAQIIRKIKQIGYNETVTFEIFTQKRAEDLTTTRKRWEEMMAE
jgi:sugar phosphate isomerase/epimerase